jgi:hypothetical protein
VFRATTGGGVMGKCTNFVCELREELQEENLLGWLWFVVCSILMILDYLLIGSIPLVADVFDLLNIIFGFFFVGFGVLPLITELIPGADLLPVELLPLGLFIYRKFKAD